MSFELFLKDLESLALKESKDFLPKKVIIERSRVYGIKDLRTILNENNKVSHGKYRVPTDAFQISQCVDLYNSLAGRRRSNISFDVDQVNESETKNESPLTEVEDSGEDLGFVYTPKLNNDYVKWGYFSDIKEIIGSNSFYPFFVYGDSGNGKTFMIEQACATAQRMLVRVNITEETDEDDLIGGYRLVNGDTVWQDGPVVSAMKKGAVVLLDEIDRGTDKLMCIQAILEGGSFIIKKTGEVVHPVEGFNIAATANSQGRGSLDAKYNARVLDDAFLERFVETFSQPFPTERVEIKILIAALRRYGGDFLKNADKAMVDKMLTDLTGWAAELRSSYEKGVIDSVISTRRLVFIIRAFMIYGDLNRAMSGCVSRFDKVTASAMIDLFKIKFPNKILKSSFVADTTAKDPSDTNFS